MEVIKTAIYETIYDYEVIVINKEKSETLEKCIQSPILFGGERITINEKDYVVKNAINDIFFGECSITVSPI